MNEQIPALDALVQEKLDADTTFHASLEGKSDEERNAALATKRNEIMNAEWVKANEYARNQKVRAEKAERGEKPPKDEPAVKSADKSGVSITDIYALTNAKVHEEDIEEVTKAAKLLGKSISEALKDTTVRAILQTRAEERATAEAANTATAKPGTKQVTSEELKQNLSKGQIPDKGSKEAEDLFWARRGGRPS
jgi:hypothetical protein